MADQVNPTGSLAPGIPPTLLTATASRPNLDRAAAAKPAKSANTIETLAPEASGGPVGKGPANTQAAMEQVNNHLKKADSELKFQVDDATGRTVFKLLDPGTGEVLLQIPSAEILALARNLRAMEKQQGASSGVLVDKQG